MLGLIRMHELTYLLGKNERSVRRLVDAGRFPAPVKVTPRHIGWPRQQVTAWIEAHGGAVPENMIAQEPTIAGAKK